MKQERRFIVDILFVLALFGVFAVSALVIVTIGADVYHHTVEDMGRNYNSRTATAYITEKVRQSDASLSTGDGTVRLSTLSGQPALALWEETEDSLFCTWIYYHDGYLRELYMRGGSYLGPDILDAGEKILELSALDYSMVSDNLLKISMLLPDGDTPEILLSLRCP